MQIYAVIYCADGNFLIGKKLTKGYFFYNNTTHKGTIVKAGQTLNGSDKPALPGGKREVGESISNGARREFFEETNIDLNTITISATTEHQFSNHYAAAYFRVDSRTLNDLITQSIPNLLAAQQAAFAIQMGQITQYSAIVTDYPKAPRDNELESMYSMDVKNSADWATIQSWKWNSELDWYYSILLYLKTTLI